ncbi:MAG: DUF2079 domain-containing protein, partial [Bdellovibrionales bacterium]|nr:DUF2079 domain-containing protein [Bdellovibrionales bacterium]
SYVDRALFPKDNLLYLLALIAPTLGIALLSPLLTFANPILIVNLVSDWPYAHKIDYQYVAGVIPTIFIGMIYGFKKIESRWPKLNQWATENRKSVYMILALSVIIQIQVFAPNYLKIQNALKDDPQVELEIFEDIKKITPIIGREPISVHYLLLPTFAMRDIVYMWPNPMINAYYGRSGEDEAPTSIKYLVWKTDVEMDETGKRALELFGPTETKTYKRLTLYSK